MIKEAIIKNISLILLTFILFGCKRHNNFEVKDFIPISSLPNNDTVKYTVDLEKAIINGVIIPTKNGNQDFFKFSFKLKNNSSKAKQYYYKIFYQNISYAFGLFTDNKCNINNPKANNNFYGSWNENNTGFHKTEILNPDDDFIQVTDSFCILGNPRNEKKYFGGVFNASPVTEKEIQIAVSRIKSSKEWMKQIKNKALENKISIERQIYLDAVWSVNYDKEKGGCNNRWKRNPRTGLYDFLLVIIEAEDLDKIPNYYQDVTIKDSISDNYQNPYQFY